MDTIITVALLSLFALLLNLPFGYMRMNTKKFSVMWFVYIHLPIPAIFILRRFAGLGFEVVPIIALGAILGQFLGGRLNTAARAKAKAS